MLRTRFDGDAHSGGDERMGVPGVERRRQRHDQPLERTHWDGDEVRDGVHSKAGGIHLIAPTVWRAMLRHVPALW